MAPGASQFGAPWLGRRLAQLLPGFPDVELCVAFSGGADSTALLAALARLQRPARGLRALHVDHGIHPQSAAWAERACSTARALSVPCEVLTVKVTRRRGESLEAGARAARYQALAQALRPGEALLTAHHEDDQLETVLLMLLRGAGVAGLAAMPEVAEFAPGLLVRPLLTRSRAALEAFAREAGVTWLEDPSNLDEGLDRNFLRRRVLPVVRARWPGAAATVSRSARHAAEAQRLLDELGRGDMERASHGAALSASVLRALPSERRHNALRFWIASRGFATPPSARLTEIAGPLLAARPDAQPVVQWPGARIELHAGLLRLLAPSGGPAAAPGEIRWRWRKEAVCPLGDGSGTLELRPDPHGPVSLAALPAALTIRWRKGGERLAVARGGARRALKSLLRESRLPPAARARLPLVFSAARLVAVADLWVDASVQAGPGARRRARLVWTRPMC